jgi:cobalt-zinc-cadmium efflux system outer membrane protein
VSAHVSPPPPIEPRVDRSVLQIDTTQTTGPVDANSHAQFVPFIKRSSFRAYRYGVRVPAVPVLALTILAGDVSSAAARQPAAAAPQPPATAQPPGGGAPAGTTARVPADATQPAAGALSLPEALALALQQNPSLIAARLGRPVAAAEIAIARERPNPDLSFEADRETPHYLLGVTLPIETGSKRGRRTALAEATSETAAAEIARTEADTRRDVRQAFYDVVASERRVEIAREVADLARRARDAAQARVQAGDAPRLEALQAELELARAENDLAARDGERLSARVVLNALLGRPADAPTTVRGDLDEGNVPDASMAVTRALEASSDLAALDRRTREAQAHVALARALQIPDLSLLGTVTNGAPGEFTIAGYHAGFSLTVPLFTTHRAGVVREERALAQARAEHAAAVAQTSAAVTAAVARAQALHLQIERENRDILPRAREVEGMAEDSYRSGQTGLVALLQALQTARDIRLQALDTALSYQQALAELERAIGAPLP